MSTMNNSLGMPRSPKRNGMIVEEGDWPLKNKMSTPRLSVPRLSSLNMPRLSLSPSSSNEHLDRMMPSTPTGSVRCMPTTPVEEKTQDFVLPSPTEEAVVLPGFHFSTTDKDVDPAEFHRIAAQLLSGEATQERPTSAQDFVQPTHGRQLHCDLGRDPSRRHCCSCGKSYSTSFRLREHVQQCAGTAQHPCQTCDKVFETTEKLNKHVISRHNNNLESCPECGESFPANLLPKHLASGLGGCDGMVQLSMGPTPEIDEAYDRSSRKSTSQHYWIYDGDLRWNQSRKSVHDSLLDEHTNYDEVVDQTISYVQRLLKRPESQSAREPCDLCGEMFSTDTDALAQHIGNHSLEFTEKRHQCDECCIYFANERDLERHLQSVNLNQHCGFTFRHVTGTCSGHHPPTNFKSSVANDHNLMQKHLWAWELAQLRTHRVTVARLLAERLSRSSPKSMSLQNCRRTYNSLLPHVSIASRDSLRPGSSGSKESDTASLDAHFSRILSEAFPEHDDRSSEGPDAATDIRPDSSVIPAETKRISKRKSWVESMSKRKSHVDGKPKSIAVENVKSGHKRAHSGPIGFWKSAQRESSRPKSLPSGVKAS